MELNPEKIFAEIKNKSLDKASAFDLLISLIENSEDNNLRVKCIEGFTKIGLVNNKAFELLEHLLLSDESEAVRNEAIKAIEELFHDKALKPLKWALEHEIDYDCQVGIIKKLIQINTVEAKLILLEEVEKIRKKKKLFADKNLNNKIFRKALKELFKTKKISNFSIEQLGEIIINFRTIYAIKRKYFGAEYQLENGLVTFLNLTNIIQTKGMPPDWVYDIADLSEIPGFRNLFKLTKLYLDNNQIKNLSELIFLKNLTELRISNNRIEDVKNIEFIKKMKKLKYLDISGNKLAEKINIADFPNVNIKVKAYFYY